MEKVLRRQPAFMIEVLKTVGALITVLDGQGRIVSFNRACEEATGYSLAEVKGKYVWDFLLVPEEVEPVKAVFAQLKAGQFSNTYENYWLAKDGARRLFRWTNSCLTDSFGAVEYVVGTGIDVTDSRLAEEALRQQAQLLHLSYDAIVVWRKDGGIERWNRGAEQLYGFTESEALGRVTHKLLKTIHPVPWLEIEAAMRKHGQWEGELRHFAKDGHEVTVSARHQLVLGTDGIERILETNRDITERKRAEEALRRSKLELELRVQERTAELKTRAEQLSRLSSELTLIEQKERRRFAGILHDDLQQLLIAAKMNQELVLDKISGTPKATAKRVLDLINRSIQGTRSLNVELAPPVLNSGDLSSSLHWLSQWMKGNQGFEVKVDSETPIVLDRKDFTVLLFQSVRELLLNVVKHSGVKSASVRMEHQNGELRIVVTDRGAGFDPESVWQHGASGGKFGLISIRERMQHLGGRFEVDSAPNAGSVISLIVPLAEKRSTEIEVRDLSRETPTKLVAVRPGPRRFAHRKGVMVVDDHPVMREGLCRLLASHADLEVVGEASDGKEAVELARQIVPDVILMDINMPTMDGLEATRIIHSEFPHIRIVGLSMYDDDGQSATMIDAGASVYRSKSGNTAHLLAAIRGEVE